MTVYSNNSNIRGAMAFLIGIYHPVWFIADRNKNKKTRLWYRNLGNNMFLQSFKVSHNVRTTSAIFWKLRLKTLER